MNSYKTHFDFCEFFLFLFFLLMSFFSNKLHNNSNVVSFHHFLLDVFVLITSLRQLRDNLVSSDHIQS